jgi:hypothetical protein
MPRKPAKVVKPPKAPKAAGARRGRPPKKVDPNASNTPPSQQWPPAAMSTLSAEQANAKLQEWYALRQKLEVDFEQLIDREMALRKELFTYYNPNPQEGTTKLELGNGWRLEMVYGLKRDFDTEAMDAVFAKLPPGSKDWLVRYKPELQVKTYKEMPEELRKVLDECIITKPTAPVLRLVPPVEAAS